MKAAEWGPIWLRDVLWVAACLSMSGCIAWQGWKSIVPFDDTVPYILSATELAHAGILPSRGGINTYNSVSTPGTAWLFLPGVILFSDYRLFEVCGSLALQAGTLVGLFLLAGLSFGRPAARMAVLLYAISPIGVFYAGSLWPRGHPVFVVWFIVLIIAWHTQRSAKHLAAALVVYAIGMYVYMEIAPIILLIPVVWYFYRPPLGIRWLVLATFASLLIWFPYLRFEQTRQFRDLESVVFQVDTTPAEHGRLICDPDLRKAVLKQEPDVPSGRVMSRVAALVQNRPHDLLTDGVLMAGRVISRVAGLARNRPHSVLTGLLANFTLTEGYRGADSALLWLRAPFLLFLALLVLMRFAPLWFLGGEPPEVDRQRFFSACLLVAVATVVFAALFLLHRPHELASLETGPPADQTTALAATLALLAGVYQWRRSRPVSVPDRTLNDAGKICLLALLLPWVTLLLIAEPILRRYLFLWPLHAVLLGIFATRLLGNGKTPAITRYAAQIALVVIVATSSVVLARLSDWRTNGWAGADSDALLALSFIATEVHRDGPGGAAIGYSFPAAGDDVYQEIDPRYRIGMEFDYILDQRFGVRNSDRCPEGISPEDEYRLFQLGPDRDPPEYVSLRRRSLAEFQPVARFGEFLVLRRRRA
jgi:hypothetical protein